MNSVPATWGLLGLLLMIPGVASGQEPAPRQPPPVHEHVAVSAPTLTPTRESSGSGWVPVAAKIQGGYLRSPPTWRGLSSGVGATMALSVWPPELSWRYGGRTAPSFTVFLNVRAAKHQM